MLKKERKEKKKRKYKKESNRRGWEKKRPNEWLRSKHQCTHLWWPREKNERNRKRRNKKGGKYVIGPSCYSSAMEIRAGQRPPRSTPEDQTSLSFDRTSGKSAGKSSSTKPWRKKKNMMMEKIKKMEGESISLLHLSSQFPGPKLWTSHGSSDAPSKRGCSTLCDIFIYHPPSAIKVGGGKEKEREINVHPLLLMVEMFLSKSQGRNYAHLKKCSSIWCRRQSL